MDKTFLAVVCGATASGKTALAVDLALSLGGEVISADSMQIYKGMDVASAKPTEAEKRGVPHHLMDFLSPTESFSVADYVQLARKAIEDVAKRGKLPIVCGGTGLYINSLIDNIVFDDTGSDMAFREKMRRFAEENGNEALWSRLNETDPESAKNLHFNNQSRIIRALEVYHLSGKKMSEVQAESRAAESPYEPCMLAIDFPDREKLYQRINARVELMMQAGLLDEAREFFTHSDYDTAAQAIGYKELKSYFDGSSGLEESVENLKQQTRKYAKRQLTWFRRDKRINWLVADEYCEILKKAENLVKRYSI